MAGVGIAYALSVLLLAACAGMALLSFADSFSRFRASPCELAVFSVLLAPAGISWVLWIGMLLFPGKVSPLGYVVAVPSLFLMVAVLLRSHLAIGWSRLQSEVSEFCRGNGIARRWLAAAAGAAAAFLALAVFWSNFVTCYHVDMSEYILAGDYFARVRDVTYHGRVVDPSNGFWLHAYHSYCLPLFAAWGVFVRQLFGGQEDWSYRFVMLYYLGGLNLVSAMFLVRRQMDSSRWGATFTALLALNTMPIMWRKVPFVFDCDPVRVSFIMAVVWVLWQHLRRPQLGSAIVLGILGAAAVAAHGTSVFFVAILYSSLLFAQEPWRRRLRHVVVVVLAVFALWGVHYALQTAFGDGWIFEDRTEEVLQSPDAAAFAAPQGATTDNGLPAKADGLLHSAADLAGACLPRMAPFLVDGCLGQLFDVSHFSIVFVFVAFGVVLLARRLPQMPACHRMLIVSLVAMYCLVAVWLNFNFRYRFTLVPLMLVGSIRLLMDEPLLVGRMTRKAWLVLWLVVLTAPLVLTLALMDSKMATEQRSSDSAAVAASPRACSRADGWVGRARQLIVGRLRPLRPVPPWPESGTAATHPRVVFTDVSKIMYRSAPFPVWYCDKRSALVGPRGPCRLGSARLAEAFDFLVLREDMRPDFVPECFQREDWLLLDKGGGCAVYRSRLRPGVDGARGGMP